MLPPITPNTTHKCYHHHQVSRTVGDKEAKIPKYGGNPKVVIAEPDIKHFQITDNFDFALLASNSIDLNL